MRYLDTLLRIDAFLTVLNKSPNPRDLANKLVGVRESTDLYVEYLDLPTIPLAILTVSMN